MIMTCWQWQIAANYTDDDDNNDNEEDYDDYGVADNDDGHNYDIDDIS